MIKDLFSRISPYYDLMNDVMSFGLHRIWKNEFVKLVPKNAKTIIDIAGGTGDIAKRLAKKHDFIQVCDISEEMVKNGRARFVDQGILNCSWMIADAALLPYENESADVVTMVFGLRNISNKEASLSEVYRVLKDHGVFLCMEFCPNPGISGYDFYLNSIIPFLGHTIAKDRDAYQYLADSIKSFWSVEELEKSLSHFQEVSHIFLAKRIVAIYKAVKIKDI